MRNKSNHVLPFAVLILVILFSTMSTARADTIWTDNFNDGNYDNWIVTKGIFAIGSIEGGSNCLLGNQGAYSVIHHDSIISVGTWSFSLYYITDRTMEIYFMATEEPTSDVVDGYKLDVWSTSEGNPIFKIRKCVDGWDDTLGQYTSNHDSSSWISIRITRTVGGRICLYAGALNTVRVDVQDSSFSSSEYFGFCAGFTIGLDSITVSDTVDIDPPPTSTEATTEDSVLTSPNPTSPSSPASPSWVNDLVFRIVMVSAVAIMIVVLLAYRFRDSI